LGSRNLDLIHVIPTNVSREKDRSSVTRPLASGLWGLRRLAEADRSTPMINNGVLPLFPQHYNQRGWLELVARGCLALN
jgi:hypothetical protein